MDTVELNDQIRLLVRSFHNTQAFADLASLEKNWRRIDKTIALPRDVGMFEGECPFCEETIRLIYDKLSQSDYEEEIVCPHCKETIKMVGEYSGYTAEIHLED